LGVIEDHSNRTRLAKLLRFHTSKDGGEGFSSLEEYVERMQEGQDKIFFCAGQTMEEVKSSPFTESLLKKNYEIIYLVEPVDEYTIQGENRLEHGNIFTPSFEKKWCKKVDP